MKRGRTHNAIGWKVNGDDEYGLAGEGGVRGAKADDDEGDLDRRRRDFVEYESNEEALDDEDESSEEELDESDREELDRNIYELSEELVVSGVIRGDEEAENLDRNSAAGKGNGTITLHAGIFKE